jgi:hypothetical protein
MREPFFLILFFLSALAANGGEPLPGETGDFGQTGNKPLPKGIVVEDWYVGYNPGGGKGSRVMRDSWIPVHLVMVNHTKNVLDGRIGCSLTDRRTQNRYASSYCLPVMLPGHHTRKHFTMYIYHPPAPQYYNDEGEYLNVRLESLTHGIFTPDNSGQRFIMDYARDRKVEVDWEKNKSYPRRFVLLLGDKQSTPVRNLLIRQAASCREKMDLKVENADVDSLSRHWAGYSGVSTLLWDGMDLSSLSDPSHQSFRQAVLDYVQSGGHLLIALGENLAAVQRSALAELLPGEIIGEANRDLAPEYGLKEAPTMLLSLIRPGQDARVILAARDGTPLAVRRDYGAGCVTALAFSLKSPLLQAVASTRRNASGTGKANLEKWHWQVQSLLFAETEFNSWVTNQEMKTAAARYLDSSATRRLPSRLTIASGLLIYMLVLVPLTYFLFRGWDRLEWAWLAMPGIAVVFGAGIYVLAFSRLEGNLSVTEISFSKMDPSGKAGTLAVSLLHNPSYDEYDLSFANPATLVTHLRIDALPNSDEDRGFEMNYLQKGESFLIEKFHIDFNSRRLLEYAAPVKFGEGARVYLAKDFRAQADNDNPGEPGKIDNLTGHTFWMGLLVYGDRGYLLEKVNPGRGQPLKSRGGAMDLAEAVSALRITTGRKEQLEGFLLPVLKKLSADDKRCFFIGIANEAPQPWLVGGKEIESRDLSIVCVPCDEG